MHDCTDLTVSVSPFTLVMKSHLSIFLVPNPLFSAPCLTGGCTQWWQ